MRIGVLTAGGDCPGLNAAIRAVARSAMEQGDETIGIRRGYRGLAEDDYVPLDMRRVSGILHQGGTILSTSSFEPIREGAVEKVTAAFAEQGFDAVVAIGGEHTMEITRQLYEDHGLPLVGVPKTIDNDVGGTDFTFGFDTAVQIVTDAIDRLHTTAQSHDRIMVVEVMGRSTGWIAAYAGLAGGADCIVIPEQAMTVEEICRDVTRRHDRGKDFSIVVVAEGAKLAFESGEERLIQPVKESDEYGYPRLGGIAAALASELEDRTGYETRVTVLGHVQRGGTPTSTDRVLASLYGAYAYELAKAGDFGKMAAIHGRQMLGVPLSEAVKVKQVDLRILEIAKRFFT
ncbi:MAG TPA: ATP-dependent 6-phosphofructokinase [Solirubrobacterales bacterium]|nr:ATP-dependent 6-phosphofructokinase [Solirubrobacterales bacterium]